MPGWSGRRAGLVTNSVSAIATFLKTSGNFMGKNGLKMGDLLARLWTRRDTGSSRWPPTPSTELSELAWLFMAAANH